MPRERSPDSIKAEKLYRQGMSLVDIAKKIGKPNGTVRRWKSTQNWDDNESERSDSKASVRNDKNSEKKKVVVDEVKQLVENPDLTDKQKLFCVYYVRCFNATKAYQKAYGVSYITAKAHGFELLKSVAIKKEINRLKQNRLNREFLSEADIFQKYMDIAFADITDFVEFGREKVPVMGAFGPVEVKDEETGQKIKLMQEINTVRFKESYEVDGTLISEVKQGKNGASVKLPDRMKALDWLANHMDMATDEQKARITHIKAQTDKLTGNNAEVEDMEEIEGDIYGSED